MRQIVASSLLVACIACGGGSGPAPSPTPTPQPSSFTLSGSVSEAAPTATTMVTGATVTVTDGPNANQSITTDSAGHYTMTLKPGGFTVRVRMAGYEDNSLPVTLTSNQTLNATLTPTFNQMHATGGDTVSGGDDCGITPLGCKAYRIDVYHQGAVDFVLAWQDGATYLWLELYDDDGNRLVWAHEPRSAGLRQHISSSVSAGHAYAVVVRYASGARTTPFTLTSSWPRLH